MLPTRKLSISLRLPLLALAMATVTTGCGLLYKQPIYQGNLIGADNVRQLQVGMSRQDVIGLLGTPSIVDPFQQNRWDYTATQRLNRRGTTEVKNYTVWFENDSVVRFEGDYFPEQDDELAKNSVRQFGPNLSRDNKKQRRR